jgi:hypothetical protein
MSEPTDDNPWVLLGELLSVRKVSVSKLAHAIREVGIETYNQHGIRIYATEGSKEDKTSKAYVLELLADYFKISDDPQPTNEQLADLHWSTEWDGPLNKFGWPMDELPDFNDINPDYVTEQNALKPFKTKSKALEVDKNNYDWKESARQIADQIFDHDSSLGTRRTLKDYSEKVMEKMQENMIHGPRGRITNPNTVMREALQGDKWWAKKPK